MIYLYIKIHDKTGLKYLGKHHKIHIYIQVQESFGRTILRNMVRM